MFTTQERRTLAERKLQHVEWGNAASFVFIDSADDEQWRALEKVIARAADGDEVGAGVRDLDVLDPLRQVFAIVRAHGCQTVIFEHRYVDQDFLSDYAAFWSEQFADRQRIAKRLHFFKRRVTPDELLELPSDDSYLGYTIIRPTGLGPLGRTVLTPPTEAPGVDSVLTRVTDRPSLFGNELHVTGVPFMQQDGEFLRCAHTAAWICNHVSWRNGVVSRMVTGQIATLPSADTSPHRPLPASGLNWDQLQGIFSAMGLPAGFYEVDAMPPVPAPLTEPEGYGEDLDVTRAHDRRIAVEAIRRVVCPNLNSGLPVIVLTDEDHAFTLVGWRHADDGDPELIACDDQRGPYVITDPVIKSLGEPRPRNCWESIMVPLPASVMLSGIAAELDARSTVQLTQDAVAKGRSDVQMTELAALAPRLAQLDGDVSVRSRLMLGRAYKQALDRARADTARTLFRMAHLPQWVWVVEFQDRVLRSTGEDCVLAEIVFDASSTDSMPIQCLISTQTLSRDLAEARRGREPAEYEADGGKRPWRSLIVDRPTRGTMTP
jgi:hypothetical protein